MPIPTPTVRVLKWQPPPINTVKVNWNATLDISSKVSCFGGIAKNALVQVLASFYVKVKDVSIPIIAKALALRKSMLICADLDFTFVLFERDCLVIVNWSNSLLEPPPVIRPIILDIQNLLQLYLN